MRRCWRLAAVVLVVMLLVQSVPVQRVHAAPRGISRANCFGRNESITWDSPWTYNWYWTNSYHYETGVFRHSVITYWLYGAYATAGDSDWSWGMAVNAWSVIGRHWYWSYALAAPIELAGTYATTCNAWSW